MFSPDFKEFIELLNKNEALYLVVGGYAVGVHGHPRYTVDLDIWLLPEKENTKKILKAINEFGFGSLGISEDDLTREGIVIQLGYPPLRIDLLTAIDGFHFRNVIQVEKQFLLKAYR